RAAGADRAGDVDRLVGEQADRTAADAARRGGAARRRGPGDHTGRAALGAGAAAADDERGDAATAAAARGDVSGSARATGSAMARSAAAAGAARARRVATLAGRCAGARLVGAGAEPQVAGVAARVERTVDLGRRPRGASRRCER